MISGMRVATIFPNCYRTRRGFHWRRTSGPLKPKLGWGGPTRPANHLKKSPGVGSKDVAVVSICTSPFTLTNERVLSALNSFPAGSLAQP